MNKKMAIMVISDFTGIAESSVGKRIEESSRCLGDDTTETQIFEFKSRHSNVVLLVNDDSSYIIRYTKEYRAKFKSHKTTEQVILMLRNRYGVRACEDSFISYTEDGVDFVELYVGPVHVIVRQEPGNDTHIKLWRSYQSSVA